MELVSDRVPVGRGDGRLGQASVALPLGAGPVRQGRSLDPGLGGRRNAERTGVVHVARPRDPALSVPADADAARQWHSSVADVREHLPLVE